uniref:Uncharacterized protein n=1 Tax=Schistosoma curassoni TaxID=6186 RepID=A0A183K5Q6_9TREM
MKIPNSCIFFTSIRNEISHMFFMSMLTLAFNAIRITIKIIASS